MIGYELLDKLLPYFFVFYSLFFLFIVSLKFNQNRYVLLATIMCSVYILTVFAGLRTDTVDPDFKVYRDIFDKVCIGEEFTSHTEKGYLLINWIVCFFTGDFNVFLLIFLSLSLCFLSATYYRMSYFPLLSIMLYYVHYYLGRDLIAIRSALSYSIVIFFIVSYNYNNNTKKYIAGIFFASLFHKTAMLSLIVVPIKLLFDRFGFKKLIVFLSVVTFFGVVFSPKELLVSLAAKIYGSSSIVFIKYFESSDILFDLGVFNLVNIKNVFLILLGGYYLPERYRFLLVVFSCGSLSLISFHDFGLLAARSLSQIIMLDTILIPVLVGIMHREQRYIGFLFVVLYAAIMLTVNVSRPGAYFYENVLM